MALFKVDTESLATTESLVYIALGMVSCDCDTSDHVPLALTSHDPCLRHVYLQQAIGWALVLETSKSMIYRMLSKTTWWKERADHPTRMMMKNFGFPSEPTKSEVFFFRISRKEEVRTQ